MDKTGHAPDTKTLAIVATGDGPVSSPVLSESLGLARSFPLSFAIRVPAAYVPITRDTLPPPALPPLQSTQGTSERTCTTCRLVFVTSTRLTQERKAFET